MQYVWQNCDTNVTKIAVDCGKLSPVYYINIFVCKLLGIWRHDTQPNNTQHNDIQHNDTQQTGLECDTQHK